MKKSGYSKLSLIFNKFGSEEFMADRKKEKTRKITYRMCRKIKRSDGLRMKALTSYTFPAFLDAIVSRTPSLTAYSVFGEDREKGISYSHLKWYSECTASFLLKNGIRKGDRVAIMGESCPHWMVMYLGCTIIGAVTVPVLPDFSASEVREILRGSGATAVCINTKHYRKIEGLEGLLTIRMDDLSYIPVIAGGFDFGTCPGISIKEKSPDHNLIRLSSPSEDDVASIIYTSGTTGSSKGVVLTQKNLLVCADESTDTYVRINKGDKVLSILPMSHAYEFSISHLLCLLRGAEITFLGKPPATTILMKAFREVRPHIILTVPLLIEKIYRSAVAPVLKNDEKVKRLMKNPLTRRLVYHSICSKLKTTIGGRMKFFGIGGAPLDAEVEEFLFHAHFPYAPGYGLTETSPLIAASGPKRKMHRLGYIGKTVKHDDVILLDKNEEGVGEIAVRGPNVMKGYYNNDALNSEVFTPDGYFRTGDLGCFNREGFLAIKGRVKTMILGPAGENIYPESIEGILNNMDFVQESLIVPGKGGLVALIKLDLEAMMDSLKMNADEVKKYAAEYLQKLRKNANDQLSVHSRIESTELQEEDFERTPTHKIKRFLYPKKKKDEK